VEAVVLGACGAVGREVAAGLVRGGVFDRITLADVNTSRLSRLRAELRPARGGNIDVRARRVRGSDPESLRTAVRGADVLANCTTYVLGVRVLRAAIAERVDYLDLGGLYNTPKQLALGERALRAGVRAVIGCGATPGLSNVLTRRASERLESAHEVNISFASHRDLAPSPGLLDTILDEFRPGVARYTWREGKLRPVAPFEGVRTVRFAPPLGPQEVYYVPHSETYTLPRFLGAKQLRSVAVRGTWRPADMLLLRRLSELGLTSDRPLRVKSSTVRPLDVLRALLLANPPTEPGAPWCFFLEVEVVGRRRGRQAVVRQRSSHPVEWGEHATGRMTAIPAVVGAELLAAGGSEPGVVPPEAAFDPARFLAGVRRAGVRISTPR
jgi:saccharopine dehydrogenase-like NADP-dependent oxidoreductase